MANLCIIPARGGSKRVPGKNIRLFFGYPIIHHVIRAARASGCFQGNILVSTDEIAVEEAALAAKADIIHQRSPKNASDTAVLADVILEVLTQFSPVEFPYFCCLLPTAALVNPEHIRLARQVLQEGRLGRDQVFSITRFGYPIQRALRLDGITGEAAMFYPEHLNSLSNNLEPAYHDAGQFYWFRTSAFLRDPKIIMNRAFGYEVPESQCQDIDTEEDWRLAEIKWRALTQGAAR